MLADIFTKDSANCDLVKRVIEEGNLKHAIDIEEGGKKESGEDCDTLDQRASRRTIILSPKSLFIPSYLCL